MTPQTVPSNSGHVMAGVLCGVIFLILAEIANAQPQKAQTALPDVALNRQITSLQAEYARITGKEEGGGGAEPKESKEQQVRHFANGVAEAATAFRKDPSSKAQKMAVLEGYLSQLPARQRKQVEKEMEKFCSLKAIYASEKEKNGAGNGESRGSSKVSTQSGSSHTPTMEEAQAKLAERLKPEAELGVPKTADETANKTFKNWFDTNKQQLQGIQTASAPLR